MTETCTLTATYRGRQYIGTGTPATDNSPFDEAVAAIAFTLPNGKHGEIVELENAGCKAGTLRWDGESWITTRWGARIASSKPRPRH